MLFKSQDKSEDNTEKPKEKQHLDPLTSGLGLFSCIPDTLHLLSSSFIHFANKLLTYFVYPSKSLPALRFKCYLKYRIISNA